MSNITQLGRTIPSWNAEVECEGLEKLAAEVPSGGLIVDIGVLYGSTTAVMALSNPQAHILSMDNFCWTPEGAPKPTAAMFMANLSGLGIGNVELMEGDSKAFMKGWNRPIDLCFIDGDHTYAGVHSDLYGFAPFSKVIAVHDYNSPFWHDINKVIHQFLLEKPEWQMVEIAEMLAVLRKKA
jgi:precorrin-6B methylase 2